MRFWQLSLFLCAGLVVQAQAQENSGVLRVDVASMSPCTTVVNGTNGKTSPKVSGHDIEVLNEVARRVGHKKVNFRAVPFPEIFDGVQNGSADLAVAGISITRARMARVDFSYPYLNSGLSILVPRQHQSRAWTAVKALLTKENGILALLLVSGWIVGGMLTWIFERKGGAFSANPIRGILEGMWFAQVTFATVGYGDYAPKTLKGRVTAICMMLFGIGLFGLVTAQLTASFTVQELTSDIKGPRDLRGRVVATVAATTSVDTLEKLGAEVVTVPVIQDAYPLLASGRVEAIVFDTPILKYHARNEGAVATQVVGRIFCPQDYGFAFPKGSQHRRAFDETIVEMVEDGTLESIHARWFGEE